MPITVSEQVSTTEFGQKLLDELEKKSEFEKNDVKNFVWKGEKVKSDGKIIQKEYRLMDVEPAELVKFYQHCQTMLFNNDKKNPGRITVLKIIADQRDRCGVELFYRESLEKTGASRYSIVESLKTKVSSMGLNSEQYDNLRLGDLMTVSSDYASLPYKLIIEGGIKHLGKFDRKHITLTFITKQGIWFSPEEKEEYDAISTEARPKIEAVKKYLKLPEQCNIRFDSQTGLKVKEIKAILSLKVKKYDEMTSDQLHILRYKLLFALEDSVNQHITQWNNRVSQIKKIAELRNIELR